MYQYMQKNMQNICMKSVKKYAEYAKQIAKYVISSDHDTR
jgi:hypothetical protein